MPDTLHGGGGNDLQNGGQGNDLLVGGFGADTLNGQNGSDILRGKHGADLLRGGQGRDTLDGGIGADTLAGGLGPDLFIFSLGRDVILDFDTGGNADRIDLGQASGINGWRDLSRNHMEQSGRDITIIDDEGHALTLRNIEVASLDRWDFVF